MKKEALDMRKKRRKDDLFRAALELFRTKGFQKTTIAEITRSAGTSHGTFYTYFASKEAVLDYMGRHILESFIGKMRKIAEDKEVPVEERFFSLVRGVLTFHEEMPLGQDFPQVKNSKKIHEELSHEGDVLFQALLAPLLEEGVRDWTFRIRHPQETARFLTVFLDGLMHTQEEWKTPEEKERAQEALGELLTRVLGMESGEGAVPPLF